MAGLQFLRTEELDRPMATIAITQQTESDGQEDGSKLLSDGIAVAQERHDRFWQTALRRTSPILILAVLLMFGLFALAASGWQNSSAKTPLQSSPSRVEQKSEVSDEQLRLAIAYMHPRKAAELGYRKELGFLSSSPPTPQPARVLDGPTTTQKPSPAVISVPSARNQVNADQTVEIIDGPVATVAPSMPNEGSTIAVPSGVGQMMVPASAPTPAPMSEAQPPWIELGKHHGKCRGSVEMSGYGQVEMIKAGVNTPGDDVGEVEIGEDIRCYMQGRAYFGDTCSSFYSNSEYLSLHLLGKTLKYTVDLSGSECGCNAAFYLVSMHQNSEASDCNDYYCDANQVCGVRCAEIDIQEANMHAWYSTLHVQDDGSGKGAGFGANHHQFDATQYGIGGSCIDTQLPFQVAASFPIDAGGQLTAMKITLTQEGKTCPLSFQVDEYSPGGHDGMRELSEALAAGMTPVISYWGKGLTGDAMQWMDGPGPDGQGPCAKDRANSCGPSVGFSNFMVTDAADTLGTSGTFPVSMRK